MAELQTLDPDDFDSGELVNALDKQVTARGEDHLAVEVRGPMAAFDPGRPGPTVDFAPGRQIDPEHIHGEDTAREIVRWFAERCLLDDQRDSGEWITVVECIDAPIGERRTYRAAVVRDNGPEGFE